MDKSSLGRRRFIKAGLAGLAGATLLPALKPQKESAASLGKTKATKIVYRTLGKTGIKVPIVGIGAVSFDPNLYRSALDSGIRHVDTAPSYQKGNHERMLGGVFKGRPRDSFVVATSFDPDRYLDREKRVFKANAPTRPLASSLDGSLERLGLDYVDVFYLSYACSRETTLYEPYVEALEKLKRDGKTRFIGVCTHENEPEVLRAAAESSALDVVLAVYNFRQIHREEMKRAIAAAAAAGVGIIAMKTQAGASWDSGAARGVNMTAALKWVLQDENVHASVPGITSYEQLETDLAVMENPVLTESEKKDLERVGSLPYRFSILFCQHCRQCVPQCPHRLDIPTLMRSYMYAYGYRNPARAKEALERIEVAELPCAGCDVCRVKCTVGFDVRAKAMDIFRLKAVPEGFLA
jgi:aryl-alcohol dehydrogenase-like predicted oxidoreductase